MNVRTSAEILNWQAAENSQIAAQVEHALWDSGYSPLRNVRALAILSVVQLQGTVPSYHFKQLAQATALSVPGVREVQNELDVSPAR
jgi:osmotically-inducible protein OsmY